MTARALGKVRKIAVFRPSALGDFIFCLPALHALRGAYPGAEIVYLGQRWHVAFLEQRRGPVDRVAVVPPLPGIGAPDDSSTAPPAVAFYEAMQSERFDLALQMYGGGRHANPVVQRFEACMSVGMRTPDAAPLSRTLPYQGAVNRRLQLLEVASLAGAQHWPMSARLHVTAVDRELAAQVLPDLGKRALVLLQPGSNDARRCWPAARYAALADALTEQGACVAINGSAAEAPLVRAVLQSMRHRALDLSGKLSLAGLCGLLQRCSMVVSNDTGPLHLALEIGVPSVGIYWFTNLIESAPLRQEHHRAAVSLRVACPVCGAENLAHRCEHDVSFVADVALEEVTALAMALYRDTA
ncbi:glycosyltransferase family 9 protein [Massilia sp. CF038]|uniref:glycosyltransferase family 9 protein n=1 Tax=Massilia sp. CF038 TaxID=1881045 RepID=UPI00091E20EF|nr:glycosyltransferase family 9 protein [Massilia sp. CF038]SHH67453.1 ADP-heptose:LPS heptosyltransferase [Massilia sp. CF038]